MTPATRALIEILLRHAKGVIVETEKLLKALDKS